MNRAWLNAIAVAAALICWPLTAVAHHSFAAEFDAAKPVTLTGTVVKLHWTNPHAHIQMTVKDEAGTSTSWDFELGSPNALIRRGWSGHSLMPGDLITVSGYLAKDGSHLANARAVTLSNGRNIFAGSSLDSASER